MEIIQGKATWIDVVKKSQHDIDWIKQKFKIHPVILDELKGPSARAHVEHYGSYLYLVYQFPIFEEAKKVSRRSEVDFIITKNTVITVHYEELLPLAEFKKDLGRNAELKDKALSNTLLLAYNLLLFLISFEERQLRHIQEKIEKVGAQLFKNKEKYVLQEISYLKPDLSEYRIIIRPQEHLLKSLLDTGVDFWGKSGRVYLNDLIGDHLRLTDQIEDYREALEDFEDTNNQLISIKNTEVTKTFTILAFLTFPLMLFSALFTIGAEGTPLVDRPGAFWIILVIMLAAMAGMFAYFKSKKWL
ncbi:MAG: hypothetical protein HYT13_02535 [Candidatus Liptonbacteria bacterium]|nr:hypothetical protein [Candidatus Liptonbacteria bacterium]